MRKFLLVLTLSISLFRPAFGAVPFLDVPQDHWAYADIEALYDRGDIEGKSAEVYDPNGEVTVAEWTKMLMNTLGLDTGDYFDGTGAATSFSSNQWFYNYVNAAVNLGFYRLTPLTFDRENLEDYPNTSITRMEALGMIIMSLQPTDLVSEGGETSHFADLDQDEVQMCYALTALHYGIMYGYDEPGYPFRSENLLSRAEAAVMANRIYQLISDPAYSDEFHVGRDNYTVYSQCD